MFAIKAKITKGIDDLGYPPFVECEFVDAHGNIHAFNDKVVIFTTENLDKNSSYPTDGIVGCEIIEREHSIIKVDTELPWHIESISGKRLFM